MFHRRARHNIPFYFLAVAISIHTGCSSSEHKAAENTLAYAADVRKLQQIERCLLESSDSQMIERTYQIENRDDEPADYVLVSKSCGCLGDLPQRVHIPARSNRSVALRTTVHGAPSVTFVGHSAVYENSSTGSLIQMRLVVWTAPYAEIRRTSGCDGRVVWMDPKSLRTGFTLVHYATTKENLHDGVPSIRHHSQPMAFTCDSSVRQDSRSGFWLRESIIELSDQAVPVGELIGSELTVEAPTRPFTYRTSLQVRLRDTIRVTPASLFVRAGTACSKTLVVTSDEKFRILTTACETNCLKASTTSHFDDAKAYRISISYDGGAPETAISEIRLVVNDSESVVHVPVYFLRTESTIEQGKTADASIVSIDETIQK